MKSVPIILIINGEKYDLEVKPFWSLLYVIRDKLGLVGTKLGCNSGECGACTVLVDGKAINSCLMLAAQANGKEITTIEGLEKDDKLHPLQQAFIDHFAVQCGYCTPGVILSAKALLDKKPNTNEEEVREAIKGNLCRCTGYVKIVEAILACSKEGGE
jgi:aerobic-type carbon monoxide dehydrogenase small subunit (CoxS/CutS family)